MSLPHGKYVEPYYRESADRHARYARDEKIVKPDALSESYRKLAGVSMSAKDIIIQNAMINSYSEVLGLSSATGEKKNLATVLETAEGLQRRFGLSRQESLKMSWDTAMVYEAGAKAGTSVGLPGVGAGGPSLGAGVKARGVRETDASAAERYEEARDYSSQREKAKAYSEVLSGESSFGAGLDREYTQRVFSDMRGRGYSDSYTGRGLTDLRDGRYDTEEAEAVSGSIHRVTGLEGLVGAGSNTRESVAAIPADDYGLGDVRRFEVDAEQAFGEYRKSAAEAGGGGIEPARSSIEQDSAAVRECVTQARKRARRRIETAETKTAEDFGAGKAEIREGREGLRHSTKGVQERLENARSESVSREQRMSEIAKAIQSSRAQQRETGPD